MKLKDCEYKITLPDTMNYSGVTTSIITTIDEPQYEKGMLGKINGEEYIIKDVKIIETKENMQEVIEWEKVNTDINDGETKLILRGNQ